MAKIRSLKLMAKRENTERKHKKKYANKNLGRLKIKLKDI